MMAWPISVAPGLLLDASSPGVSRNGLPDYPASLRSARNPVAVSYDPCDNYVMRSTRDVDDKDETAELGHYSDPPLLVLASLADGPKHGHVMIEDIVELSGTRLGPGTLYGAIARLEQQGLIKPLEPDERRQPYKITAAGLRVLRAKLTTLHQFSKAGLKRLEAL